MIASLSFDHTHNLHAQIAVVWTESISFIRSSPI